MNLLAGTLLLAASLQQSPRLSLIDVPYLSQSEALCGGAAAAMVLRYWGTPAAAEDFAPLVDRRAGGIATAALVRELRARGWDATGVRGTAAIARRELEQGRPAIALIEDRPGTFHYVVIVGWHERAIVVHDPARTPYAVLQPAEFERRWEASGYWLLVIVAGVKSQIPNPKSQTETSSFQLETPKSQYADADADCDGLVAAGVRSAQQNDLAKAERTLAGAAFRCDGAAPYRELAGVRLLQRRWPEVRELAGRAVALDPRDAHAWRLLATGRYIGGDHGGALEAWNRAGEPVIDLVSVSGLHRTRHRVVERLLGLEAGEVITRQAAERAERRLAELPAAWSTLVEYVPRGAGRAEVRANVAEQAVVVRGLIPWAVIGLQAAATLEAEIGVASLTGGGERLAGRWRFWPGRPAYGVSLSAPAAWGGIFKVEGAFERQPFRVGSESILNQFRVSSESTLNRDAVFPDAERTSARASWGNWVTATARWEVRGGVDKWRGGAAFGVIGSGVRIESTRARLDVGGDVWAGNAPFAAGHVRAGWRSSAVPRGVVFDLRGGLEAVHDDTPLDFWPAGDTGHARKALLRAHPVLDEGRLRVERLGRQVSHVTAEAQHWWSGRRLVPIGAAAFVDAARTAGRRVTGAVGDVDTGLGLRIALPGAKGLLRADMARGLRDGRWAFSFALDR